MDFHLEDRFGITFNVNGVNHDTKNIPNELHTHLKILYNPRKHETREKNALIELDNKIIPRVFKQGDNVLVQLCDGIRCGSLINDSYGLFGRNLVGAIHYTAHPAEGSVVIWLATGFVESERKHIMERFEFMKRHPTTYKLFLTRSKDISYTRK